jgi:hypothetical protein
VVQHDRALFPLHSAQRRNVRAMIRSAHGCNAAEQLSRMGTGEGSGGRPDVTMSTAVHVLAVCMRTAQARAREPVVATQHSSRGCNAV